MNRQETAKIIMYLKAAYNAAYGKYTEQDFANTINLWTVIFADCEYKAVEVAVLSFISSDTSKFPPVPAQIKEMIQTMQEMNEPPELLPSEAWALGKRAIENSGYYAKEEFEKLPPDVQKAFGSADVLHAKSQDAYSSWEDKEKEFTFNYKAVLERKKADKTINRIPVAYRELIANTTERLGITG